MNIGIIGFGGMGEYHSKSIQESYGLKVTAVYDINPQRTEKAENLGYRPYYDLESILADESIDIILIATPNNFHKEITVKALKAGKNVICEKPVALSSADLEEMIATAKQYSKMFTVHQNRRWDKDFLIVKKTVEENLLGKPFYIESRVQAANGIPGDWRCVKEAGGGMLLDWGVHLIDQILYMVKSPVTEVYAHLLSVKFNDVDDNFKLMLKFENGISALVEVDTYCFHPLPRWHMSCESGTLVINGWDCSGSITKAKTTKVNFEPGIVYTAAGPTRTMAPRPVETLENLPLPEVELTDGAYYKNIADYLNGKSELFVKPEQCMRVIKIIEAVFNSSQNGICVKCNI